MKFSLSILFLLCITYGLSYSQSKYVVKGSVSDTTTNQKLQNATISVLTAQDSILQKFQYSGKTGDFNIGVDKPGKYLLMVTYPDYADFVEVFTLSDATPVFDFKNLRMILKSLLLNEVIIKARMAAIKIKGDTTEFDAAAYATQKNARVEDLLKQLPGMRINQSGEILFQGETISRVLVDGEEFFGDDPALVTKNIRADMVSKIQVYDQKSENAKLTGVDDGVKVKTINVVLTEDKKKGLFGKAEVGGGSDDYYVTQLMANKFAPKQKISIYGNLANTGRMGLSNDDFSRLGMGNAISYYGSMGIPVSRDAGVHYDSKLNKDKQSINLNYKTSIVDVRGDGSTITQNNLPGNFNKRDDTRSINNHSFYQNIIGLFDNKLSTTSDLNIRFVFNDNSNETENENISSTRRGNNVLQNTNRNVTTNNVNTNNGNISINYVKRFKKEGRSISINTGTSFYNAKGDGYLRSEAAFYNEDGLLDSIDMIDQFKPTGSDITGIFGGASYTDAFSKRLSLSTSYNASRNVSRIDRLSFNGDLNNGYNEVDSLFSSKYKLVNESQTLNARLNYINGKTSASISNSLIHSNLNQNDVFLSEQSFNRSFLNIQPNANYRYQLTKAASLSFDYSGYARQPFTSDLQPVRSNADPLNIRLGNPKLTPAFDNRFGYNYRVYQPTKDQGINFRGWINTTMNAIISNRSTDSAGINFITISNLRERNPIAWYAYTEVYGHATKFDFIVFIAFVINGSTSYNYVNGQLNSIKNLDYQPEIRIAKNKARYNYDLSFRPAFIVNTNSLQRNINNNSTGHTTNASGNYKFKNGFFIAGNLNYRYNSANQVFDKPFEQLLVSANVGKSFFKEESFKISLTGNDLFNQNTGYSRYGTNGNFTEERNDVIRRYFMVSAIWDFTKFGKSLQKQQ